MHFTHIRRRILKIKPQLNLGNVDVDDNKPVTLIVDASGLTVSNKGDYIEEKWIRKKKEFLKLHIAVDERSEKVMIPCVSATATASRIPSAVPDA